MIVATGRFDAAENTLDRLIQSNACLVGLFAPAGYGKWRLARRFAERFTRVALVEGAEFSTPESILAEVAHQLGVALDDWGHQSETACVAIDHAESLEDRVLREVLKRLVIAAPTDARIVVCSAREPSFSLVELLNPEATLTLRARDFVIPLQSLRRRLPPEPAVSDITLYWIYQCSGGWPLVLEYLVAAALEGRFERDLDELQQLAWADLFDWFEAKVERFLDAPSMKILIEASTRLDMRIGDLREPERAAAMRLVREYQLGTIGVSGELRITSFARLYLLVRRLPAMRDVAMAIADDAEERPVRQARALINVGDFAAAERLLEKMDEAQRMSVGEYPYPGVLLERLHPNRPPLHFFPYTWLALTGTRSFVQTPLTLAEEGTVVLAQPMADRSLRAWVQWIVAVRYARSGELAVAAAHLDRFDAQNDFERGLVDLAFLVTDAIQGRYWRVFERWSRSSRWIVAYPTFYAMILRFVIRTLVATGSPDRAAEQVRLLASLTNVGGSPFLSVAAAAEGTLLAFVAADTAEFERRRTEMLRLVLDCEAPALWRFSAATFGFELTGAAPGDPFLEAAAPMMLAVHAQGEDAAILAERAVRAADASDYAWLRCASRVVAAALDASNEQQLLDEALVIARDADGAAMVESIEQLRAHGNDSGLFVPVLARLRSNALEAERRQGESLPPGGLFFDVGTGRVTRDGASVDISDGTLALITLIAMHRSNAAREIVLDTLWPNVDADSAGSALKMCLRRARTQLDDPDAILFSRGVYSFGAMMRCNFENVVDYATKPPPLPLPDAIRAEMNQLSNRLQAGGHGAWAPWSWFSPYAKVLTDAYQSIGETLVRDALERGENHLALSTARNMVSAQPLDESPRVLVVRALLALNNRAAAIEEYRQFKAILRSELDMEPSREMDRLLALA